MPTIFRSITSVLLLSIGALAVTEAPVLANDAACTRSARDMRTSCNFELKEEYHATLASCRQLEDPDDCVDEAKEDRREAVGLCRDQFQARLDACDLLDEDRYEDPLLDSVDFIDPDDIPGIHDPNPYVSLVAGHTYVLRSGVDFEELGVVHVTDEVREIQGVICRVVVDVVLEVGEDEDEEDGGIDYIPVEVTDDWFAQTENGDVYYCGEIARNFEDGVLRDLDGSFESGVDFAKAGLLVPVDPGDAHRQEYALGEAEDIVEYVDDATAPDGDEGGDNPKPQFACAPDKCLKTFEYAPLEPDASEFKYYIPGIGFVLAVALEDGEPTGERDELVCVGDSLDILDDPTCGIEDPTELRADLCEFHPEGFCEDDENDEDG